MNVFDKAIETRMDRRCTCVALGGGVIGDMCGYAAAAYLRGVNFIQIPTTVMAQVGSSYDISDNSLFLLHSLRIPFFFVLPPYLILFLLLSIRLILLLVVKLE